jgi:hypothetical protein
LALWQSGDRLQLSHRAKNAAQATESQNVTDQIHFASVQKAL